MEDVFDFILQHLLRSGGDGRGGVVILDEVREIAVVILADGSVERDGMLGDFQYSLRLIQRHPRLMSNLHDGWLPPHLLRQLL